MSSYLAIPSSSGSSSNNLFLTGTTSITVDTTFSNTSFINVLSGTVDTSLATGSTYLIVWADPNGSLTSGSGSFNWRILVDGVSIVEAGSNVTKVMCARTPLSVGAHSLSLQIQSTATGGTYSIRPQTQITESCWMTWQVTYV